MLFEIRRTVSLIIRALRNFIAWLLSVIATVLEELAWIIVQDE